MMDRELVLKKLREKIERLKNEKAQKEGARDAILDSIKKDFGVKDINEAYKKLEEMREQIEIKKERETELLNIAEEKLEGYR
ncbi:MAG: hypothetical protein PHO27_12145 [Sulfuricurvum sp.]|jgi:3-hydroxyacyl-CoA dehydrogenase|nr:hypothetical protein [Sulfuricurvum sp.]